MFIDELMPIVKEIAQQPIAFWGGFFSGMLRLNLADDPVKSWLVQQEGVTVYPSSTEVHNGKSGGPKSISID